MADAMEVDTAGQPDRWDEQMQESGGMPTDPPEPSKTAEPLDFRMPIPVETEFKKAELFKLKEVVLCRDKTPGQHCHWVLLAPVDTSPTDLEILKMFVHLIETKYMNESNQLIYKGSVRVLPYSPENEL